MKTEKKSWLQALFAYAEGERKRMLLSIVLSVLSVMTGLLPFYCMYRMICLFAAGGAAAGEVVRWCLLALLCYAGKILLFSLSTGVSHTMAYTILESLRLRLADRFLTRRWAMWRPIPSARSRARWWTRSRASSRRWLT